MSHGNYIILNAKLKSQNVYTYDHDEDDEVTTSSTIFHVWRFLRSICSKNTNEQLFTTQLPSNSEEWPTYFFCYFIVSNMLNKIVFEIFFVRFFIVSNCSATGFSFETEKFIF